VGSSAPISQRVSEVLAKMTGAQVWQPQPDGALVNPQSGKCLDDNGYGGSGTQVQIWGCSGNTDQARALP
jgi:hypothetical protein